jgi:hypothetical protein
MIGRPRRMWRDNIKVNITHNLTLRAVSRINLIQEKPLWIGQSIFGVHKNRKFSLLLRNHWRPKKYSAPRSYLIHLYDSLIAFMLTYSIITKADKLTDNLCCRHIIYAVNILWQTSQAKYLDRCRTWLYFTRSHYVHHAKNAWNLAKRTSILIIILFAWRTKRRMSCQS